MNGTIRVRNAIYTQIQLMGQLENVKYTNLEPKN